MERKVKMKIKLFHRCNMANMLHKNLAAFALLFIFIVFNAAPLWADTEHSGKITADETWTVKDNDHIITGNVTVQAGVTLTIEDGVKVTLNNNRYISVSGTLIASGTSSSGITFTGGDTSNWNSLSFSNGGNGTLNYCTIEYATNGIYVYSGAGTISLSNTTIQNNAYGVRASAGTVELTSTTIKNNTNGFYGVDVAPTLLDTNNLFENNLTGIYLQNISGLNLTTATTISNNTQTGIQLVDCATPILDNLTLTGNSGAYGAIYMDDTGEFTLGSSNTISGNSWPLTIKAGAYPSGVIPTSGNTNNDIQVYGGSSDKTGTWRLFTDLDYIVNNNVTIASNGSLTIEDGVKVKLNNNRYISVSGTLIASGTSDSGITFTSSDTSNWNSLSFSNGGNGTLNYCIIEYAINGIYVYSGAGTISLSNSTIQNNAYGVRASAGTLSFINNKIINNTNYGVYLSGALSPNFGSNLSEWNDIYGNGGDNPGRTLYNGTSDINARYIYWGTVDESEIQTKIYDQNDAVSFGTVNYNPWTNTAHNEALPFELEFFTATVNLDAGINMFSVPLNDARISRLSDLVSIIGPEVTMIISYDTAAKKFVTHMSTFPETSPTNITVKGGEGYIVMMNEAKSVTFQGLAWSGNISLSAGINLISVPVNPGPWRLSDLAHFIGAEVTMIISYDTVAQKFLTYKPTFPETSPTNVAVKGGVGYIVMMKKAKSVTCTGEAWENNP
jgi:hypothetical protein